MIQIDINRPTNCDDCPFCFDYDCIIHERVTHEYYDGSQEQYSHCPLMEGNHIRITGIRKHVSNIDLEEVEEDV